MMRSDFWDLPYAAQMEIRRGKLSQRRAAQANDFRAQIERALAEHDESMAQCPVNNPKYGRAFRPSDQCPRCKALASGSCGVALAAGYALARTVRGALGAPVGTRPKGGDPERGSMRSTSDAVTPKAAGAPTEQEPS